MKHQKIKGAFEILLTSPQPWVGTFRHPPVAAAAEIPTQKGIKARKICKFQLQFSPAAPRVEEFGFGEGICGY